MSNFQVEPYRKALGHIINGLVGFFFSPLAIFAIQTSLVLVKNPTEIGDGAAILFVALIGGLIFIWKEEVYIDTSDMGWLDWLEVFFGVLVFWILALHVNSHHNSFRI